MVLLVGVGRITTWGIGNIAVTARAATGFAASLADRRRDF
jgi:hypothetical protein